MPPVNSNFDEEEKLAVLNQKPPASISSHEVGDVKQEADVINQGRHSQYLPEALFMLPFSSSSKSYKNL